MKQVMQEHAVNVECVDLPLAAVYMRRQGIRVYDEKYANERQLLERVSGFDTLVHYFSDRPIPAAVLRNSSIKRIVVAGPAAGCFENLESFKTGSLEIYDTPSQAVTSVAEYTVTMIMALAKNLRSSSQDMENGQWKQIVNTQLAGKLVGLIGFGEVSKQVAGLCRGVGLRVQVAASEDRHQEVVNSGYQFVSLDTLLGSSDFISIHKRLTKATANLLTEEKLRLIQPHACFVNTSRSELVDSGALVRRLQSGAIAGAAMDVFDKEPLCKTSALRKMPNVIATPHNAWLTRESIDNMVSVAISAVHGDFSLARRVH